MQQPTVWRTVWIGWGLLAAGLVISGFWWTLVGESFLSSIEQLPAEVLVVEGWIGRKGLRAAAAEFEHREIVWVDRRLLMVDELNIMTEATSEPTGVLLSP